jgi:dihydroorotate dehydrogenase
MLKEIDLSARMAGLKFKSPILVASACAANLSLIKNLVDKNIER